MADENQGMTNRQKLGAVLLGLGTLGGIGAAIAQATKKEKPSESPFARGSLRGSDLRKRRFGRKSCGQCDE